MYGPQLTADNYTWADVGGGGFIHSSMLRHSPLPGAPPVPPRIVSSSHWADANLTLQILTLYDGDKPVRMSLMNSGRPGPGTESHPGTWSILRRVADETMRGDGYDIGGVLFTQYFTDDAEAIHLNYWLADDERGIPRSHGCLGLDYADAAFAWRFLDIGSPVYVHA
jgi:lipoprotein-anchoring transpeptidase ErfK/SrfK